MNELKINGINNTQTIDSREIAKMLDVQHYKILEKLEGTKDKKTKGIVPTFTDHEIVVSDYFIQDTYKDTSGKENKCYQFTKMGCEFIANKFTGEKGIIFSAKYVKRFNDMEQIIKENKFALPTTYKEALLQLVDQVEINEVLDKENELLSAKVLEWDAIPFINACVRQYAGEGCNGNFGLAWVEFKKEILYKHSINLNSRITRYLNETGKKTKPKTLKMLDDSEIPNAVSTIVSMCREKKIDISELIKNLGSGLDVI